MAPSSFSRQAGHIPEGARFAVAAGLLDDADDDAGTALLEAIERVLARRD